MCSGENIYKTANKSLKRTNNSWLFAPSSPILANNYLPFSEALGAIVSSMDFLKEITNIEQNSLVNVIFYFNDDLSLLVEGGFRLTDENQMLFESKTYWDSEFDLRIFNSLKKVLVKEKIEQVKACENTGELSITLSSTKKLEVFYEEGTYSLWELRKGSESLSSSEGGAIVKLRGWDVN